MNVGENSALPQPVRDAARAHAPDRYLAALLAPRDFRDDLVALAAVIGELERIPRVVTEPGLGEIRLQWWRDWLDDLGKGTRTGNPVADRMTDVIARRGLQVAPLIELIDARVDDFYSDPVADDAAFLAGVDRAEAGAFRLAAAIAGAPTDAAADAVLAAAARGYGITRALLGLPFAVSRGRWPLPPAGTEPVDAALISDPAMRDAAAKSRDAAMALARAELDRARAALPTLPRNLLAAVLPAALIEPYLQALEKEDDWLRTQVEISPLTRVWRLWRAWRRARL